MFDPARISQRPGERQAMSDSPHVAYEFGNFRLTPGEKQLVCDRGPVKLQPNCAHCFTLHAGGKPAVARMNVPLAGDGKGS